jgi:rhodanese-related sulfurtransferase
MEFKTKEQNPQVEDVYDVDPKEVSDHQENLELIDVRREDEYVGELGHIPGSRLVTLDTLNAHINSLSKTKTIVFVCRSGGRSASATAMALAHGFNNVYNMKGGMILWNEYGLDVEY